MRQKLEVPIIHGQLKNVQSFKEHNAKTLEYKVITPNLFTCQHAQKMCKNETSSSFLAYFEGHPHVI